MRKNNLKAFNLSAMVALNVMGTGHVARADWAAIAGTGVPTNLSVRATEAHVYFHGYNTPDDSAPTVYGDTSGEFVWQGNATPPNQNVVTHNLSVAGGRSTYIDPDSQIGTVMMCYIGLNGANYLDFEEIEGDNYTTPMPTTLSQQKSYSFVFDPITGKYKMSVDFATSLGSTSHAEADPRGADEDNPGMGFTAGQEVASTTQATLNTTTLVAN